MSKTGILSNRGGKPYAIETKTLGEWQAVAFDSVSEVLRVAGRPLPAVNDNAEVMTTLSKGGLYWLGLDGGPAEMMAAISHGHAPGVAMVEEMLAEIPANLTPPTDLRRRRVWGDAGCTVDMQRVYGGQLDRAFQRTRRQSSRAPKVVRLVVALNAHSGTDARNFAWRGVAALALAQRLTSAGYGVEIVGTMHGANVYANGSAKNLAVTVTVKPASAPVDLSTLSAVVTLLGFFRHVGLSLFAHGKSKVSPGFGYLVLPENAPVALKPGDVTGFERSTDRSTTIEFIMAKLAEIQA
jgi:hypothetical protein